DRLGRLHAAVDVAFELDVVLVIAAQHRDELGLGREELEHDAEDAVQREEAAIDVVAEEDEPRLGRVLRVAAEGVDLVEELRLHERRLEHAVTAVEIADDEELVAFAGLGGLPINVAVEELALGGEVGDRLFSGELADAFLALVGPEGRDAIE